MKKGPMRAALLSACLTAAFATLFAGGSASAAGLAAVAAGPYPPAVGADLGDAVYTDIRAFVSGNEIPSINVDGYTAVYTDDLRDSGFDVAWRPAERKVVMTPRPGKPPVMAAERTGLKPGDKVADVLATDIVALMGTVRVPSYNIEGRTAIVLNDLDRFGAIEWDERARTLSFEPDTAGATPYSGAGVEPPLVLEATGYREIGPMKVSGSDIELDGTPVGRIDDERHVPLLSLKAFAERLGYNISAAPGAADLALDDGTYRAELVSGEAGPRLYWMGAPAGRPDWMVPPVLQNGDWLVHEQDVRLLFGCGPQRNWDWNAPPETFVCTDYSVQDFGVGTTAAGMRYEVSGTIYGDARETSFPAVMADNEFGGKPVFDARIYNPDPAEPPADGKLKRITAAAVPLEWGDNHLNVHVVKGWKVLYLKQFVLTPDADAMKPVIPHNEAVEQMTLTRIVPERPALAYSETDQASFSVCGTIERPVGDRLVYIVEKRTESGWRKVWEVRRPMPDSKFSADIPLLVGTGLYQIRLQSEGRDRTVVQDIDIAKWFVRKTTGGPVPAPVSPDEYAAPVQVTPAALDGAWNRARYPERFVGWRGYPFSLAVGIAGTNSPGSPKGPGGYYFGTPGRLQLTVGNMGEESLTIKEPPAFEFTVARLDEGKQTEVWSGKLPALQGTFAPLDYATFSAEWDARDADGRPLPPGEYAASIRLPVDIRYESGTTGESMTEEGARSIRTQMYFTIDWPSPEEGDLP